MTSFIVNLSPKDSFIKNYSSEFILTVVFDNSFLAHKDLLKNKSKIKILISYILNQNNAPLEPYSQLLISINEDSSYYTYALNKYINSISTTIPNNSENKYFSIDKITVRNSSLDLLENQSEDLIRMLSNHFNECGMLLAYSIPFNKATSPLNASINNISHSCDFLSLFSDSIAITDNDLISVSKSLKRCSRLSKRIYLDNCSDSIKLRFSSFIRHSYKRLLKYLDLNLDTEICVDSILICKSTNIEIPSKAPAMVSYFVSKNENKELILKIKIINKEENHLKLTIFTKTVKEDSNYNKYSTANSLLSSINSICSLFDYRCNSSITNTICNNINSTDNSDKVCDIKNLNLKELSQIQQLFNWKQDLYSRDFPTSLEIKSEFLETILNFINSFSFSKQSNLSILSLYAHSYIYNILTICNNCNIYNETKFSYLKSFQIIFNEIQSLEIELFKQGVTSYFASSNIIQDIKKTIIKINNKEFLNIINFSDSPLHDVANHLVLKSNEFTDDRFLAEQNFEDINIIAFVSRIINKASQNPNNQEFKKELIDCLNIVSKQSSKYIHSKQYSKAFYNIPYILLELPPPPCKELFLQAGEIWNNLSREQINKISQNLSELTKNFFEACLRLGIRSLTHDKMYSIIKCRTIHHLLLNNAFKLSLDTKNDKILSEKNFKILSQHGGKILNFIPIYSHDMIEWLNKNNTQTSGYNPTCEIEKASIIQYLKKWMSIPYLQPYEKAPLLALDGISFSDNYCLPNFSETRCYSNNITKSSASYICNRQYIKQNKNLHFSLLENSFNKLNGTGYNPNLTLPKIVTDSCTLEIIYRSLSSPGETILINDTEDNKNYLLKSTSENIEYIKSVISQIPHGIKFELNRIESKKQEESQQTIEFKFKINDPNHNFSINLECRSAKNSNNKLEPEQITHKDNLFYNSETNFDFIESAFGHISTGSENDSKLKDNLEDSFLNILSSQKYNSSPGYYNQLLLQESDLWNQDINNINFSYENQCLLRSLRISQPYLSCNFLDDSLNIAIPRFSFSSIMNIIITCIHKPNLLLRASSRRIIERSLFQTGLLSEAFLENPDFFLNNFENINKYFFNAFINKTNNYSINANVALIHLREVFYETAKNIINHLEKCKTEELVSTVIFGNTVFEINKKIKSLRSFINKLSDINSFTDIKWIAAEACFNKTKDNQDEIRGYLYNLIKLKFQNDTKNKCKENIYIIALAFGSYLKNINKQQTYYGYPEIDTHASIWMKNKLTPVIHELLISDLELKDTFLSICYNTITEDQSDTVLNWQKHTFFQGSYISSKKQLLSIFKGVYRDETQTSIDLINIEKISQEPMFKSVFGTKTVLSNIIETESNNEYIKTFLYTISNNILINLIWNHKLSNPLSIRLEIINGAFQGKYSYSYIEQDGNWSSYALKHNIWLNEHVSSYSISTISSNCLDFSDDNVLLVSLSNYNDTSCNLIIKEILNYNKTQKVVSNAIVEYNGIFSEKASDLLIFKCNKNINNDSLSLKLSKINIELFYNKNTKELKINSEKFSDCTITHKSIEISSSSLFLNSFRDIIPCETSSGEIKCLFSINKLLKTKRCFPLLSCNIINPDSYLCDVEGSVCSFYSLALLAANNYDYLSSLKWLKKSSTAQFHYYESEALYTSLFLWFDILQKHKSKKASALCLKAFSLGLKFIDQYALQEFHSSIFENKTLIIRAIEILKHYNNHVCNTKSLSIDLFEYSTNIKNYKFISKEFTISNLELETFHNLAKTSLDSLSLIIIKIIQDINSSPSSIFEETESIINNVSSCAASMCSSNKIESEKYVVLIRKSLEILFDKKKTIKISDIDFSELQEIILKTSQSLFIEMPYTKYLNDLASDNEEKRLNFNLNKNLNFSQKAISKNIISFFQNFEKNNMKEFFTVTSNQDKLNTTKQQIINNLITPYKTYENNYKCCNKQLIEKHQKIEKSFYEIDFKHITINNLSSLKTEIELKITLLSDLKDSLFTSLICNKKLTSLPSILKAINCPWFYSKNNILATILSIYKNYGLTEHTKIEDDITIYLLSSIQKDFFEKALSIIQSLENTIDEFTENPSLLSSMSVEIADLINNGFNLSRHTDPSNKRFFINNFRHILCFEYQNKTIITNKQKNSLKLLMSFDKKHIPCNSRDNMNYIIPSLFCSESISKSYAPLLITDEEYFIKHSSYLNKFVCFNLNTSQTDNLVYLNKKYRELLNVKTLNSYILSSNTSLTNIENLIIETKLRISEAYAELNTFYESTFNSNPLIWLLKGIKEDIPQKITNLIQKIQLYNKKNHLLLEIQHCLSFFKCLAIDSLNVFWYNSKANLVINKELELNSVFIKTASAVFNTMLKIANENQSSNCYLLKKYIQDPTNEFVPDSIIIKSIIEIASLIYEDLSILDPRFKIPQNKIKKELTLKDFISFIFCKTKGPLSYLKDKTNSIINSNLIEIINSLKELLSNIFNVVFKFENIKYICINQKNGCTIQPKRDKNLQFENDFTSICMHFIAYINSNTHHCSIAAFKTYLTELNIRESKSQTPFIKDFINKIKTPLNSKEDPLAFAYTIFNDLENWQIRFDMLINYTFKYEFRIYKQIKNNSYNSIILNKYNVSGLFYSVEEHPFYDNSTIKKDYNNLNTQEINLLTTNFNDSKIISSKQNCVYKQIIELCSYKNCNLIIIQDPISYNFIQNLCRLILNKKIDKTIYFFDCNKQLNKMNSNLTTSVVHFYEELKNNDLLILSNDDTESYNQSLKARSGFQIVNKIISEHDLLNISEFQIANNVDLKFILMNNFIKHMHENTASKIESGQLIKQIQYDTSKRLSEKNLTQVTRNIASHRLTILKNFINLETSHINKSKNTCCLDVLSHTTIINTIFELIKPDFILENHKANICFLNFSEQIESFEFIKLVYEKEEQDLNNLYEKINELSTNKEGLFSKIIQIILKYNDYKETFSEENHINNINIAKTFLSLPESIKKTYSNNVYSILALFLPLKTGTSKDTQLNCITDYLNYSIFNQPQKEIEEALLKISKEKACECLSNVIKELINVIINSKPDEIENHYNKFIIPLLNSLKISISNAITNLKSCLKNIIEKENFNHSISSCLQDFISTHKVNNETNFCDIVRIIKNKTILINSYENELYNCIEVHHPKKTIKTISTLNYKIRPKRILSPYIYDALRFSKNIHLENMLRLRNKAFFVDAHHAFIKIIKKSDNSIDGYKTAFLKTKDPINLSFYNEERPLNDIDRIGLYSNMLASPSVINSINKIITHSNNGALFYTAYIYDQNTNIYNTAIISRNDAFHLIPALLNDQAKLRNKINIPNYNQQNFDQNKYIQPYNHLYACLLGSNEINQNLKQHIPIHIEIFAISPNKPFDTIQVFSSIDKTKSIMKKTHPSHLNVKEHLTIYSLLFGNKQFSKHEIIILDNWLKIIQTQEKTNVLNYLSIIHRNDIFFFLDIPEIGKHFKNL